MKKFACFDITGTIIDGDFNILPEVEPLFKSLEESGWELKILTTWPHDYAEDIIKSLLRRFDIEIFSSPYKDVVVDHLLGDDVEKLIFADNRGDHVSSVVLLGDARVTVFYVGKKTPFAKVADSITKYLCD